MKCVSYLNFSLHILSPEIPLRGCVERVYLQADMGFICTRYSGMHFIRIWEIPAAQDCYYDEER